jgi:hypothetical protein
MRLWAMSEGEVRQPIGFLRLEDGPIQLDPNNLDLISQVGRWSNSA